MNKKVTLILIDLLSAKMPYPISNRKCYKVNGIINSVDWRIGDLLTKEQVNDLIVYSGDITVKIIEKK